MNTHLFSLIDAKISAWRVSSWYWSLYMRDEWRGCEGVRDLTQLTIYTLIDHTTGIMLNCDGFYRSVTT